ncbi:DUF3307 domain-containing protein [Pseudooceanicola algae]|uniref:DUF3307 domain-containing protein n=1 Tax=Pseudooceanicola algae TaxID=1537215 RepID=A0A418SEY1_9RHOB|nr:DUF3307 domain-containing protein [Pseudooceanicola algae]QPM89344.1 hypothetical protein PSAL_005590 [Pseudooceanicola algae]
MIATFAALLLAHACADFLLQSDAMAAAKQQRRAGPLLLHILIVIACTTLALGPDMADAIPPILLLGALHLVIDLAKSTLTPRGLAPFLLDQGAHLASLAGIALYWPGLFDQGFWGPQGDWLPATMALVAGLLIATRAGGYAVGLLMHRWAGTMQTKGLPRGGEHIGLMERGLIFLFLMGGEPSAIGFLIAAKSILRFDTAREDQAMGEYVIIGTLASFGWALLSAYATTGLLSALPDLGIPARNP